MESKTLKTIQTISKVCMVISKIVFIVSIVGASMCGVGILCLGLGYTTALNLAGINIYGLINAESEMSVAGIYVHMVIAAIACGLQIAMAKLCELYFRHELEAGTPFTFEGAKELKKVGICLISISLGGIVGIAIIYAIASNFIPNIGEMNADNITAVGTGIILLIVSCLCKYGAELNEAKAEVKNEENSLQEN